MIGTRRMVWVLATCGVVLTGPLTLRAAAESGHDAAKSRKATAKIEARSGSQVEGKATFTQEAGKVTLHLSVRNMSPGLHAFHIHEKGDCSDPKAASAGPHWNPAGAPHGKWGDSCHLGDIGNIEVGKNGKGTVRLTTDLWSIGGSAESDIVGRSVIVHESPDDFVTQPTGNAGGRIGCGVIRVQ